MNPVETKLTVNSVSSFKRLPVGTVFSGVRNGPRFRKFNKSTAIPLKENGVGRVDLRVPFTRSAMAFVVRMPKT